jgi:hypothetical protein
MKDGTAKKTKDMLDPSATPTKTTIETTLNYFKGLFIRF